MIEWPSSLVEALARRRVVLFLGAGISKNSINSDGKRPPTWEEFLREAANALDEKRKRFVLKAIKAGQLLDACEWIKNTLDDQWIQKLKSQFTDPKYKAAEIHRHIYDLDSRITITPNIDKIYDNYVVEKSEGTVIVKSHVDSDIIDCIRRNERLILKVHGSIDAPGQIVFTRTDYAKALIANGIFYKILESLVDTQQFLFIGAGFSDPDFQLLFERHSYLFESKVPHYMTAAKSIAQEHVDLIRTTRNIKVLKYDAKDNHIQLTSSIQRLASLVSDKRDEIAVRRDW
jgi:SIR2-like domain